MERPRERVYFRGFVGKLGILPMGKGSRSNCKSTSHKMFRDKAKNKVDDLQGIFADLQYARKESRTTDAALLEEQVHQMLREWRAELNEPSPATSMQGGSLGSFSSDICRLLQLYEEEDDATSRLAAPKTEPDAPHSVQAQDVAIEQVTLTNQLPQEHSYQLGNDCKSSMAEMHNMGHNNIGGVESREFQLHQDFEKSFYALPEEDVNVMPNADFLPNICPPPSAFLGPKCALWDCPRPAQGPDWCQDYCSSFHAALAFNEGPPGMTPVLRPNGIGLKDSLLFAALAAKVHGKDVGIPECEGAATTKSPWNAPELFDLSVLEGETIREWLFFDKPRRAFESGNRKQRSLPDYNGRGWHESRKQVINEFGGLKRSYYMDPQPLKHYEWHLYEYEISKCDICALYRLELKLADGKKIPKGKTPSDSLADLQKQMGRLTAEFPSDHKFSAKGRIKIYPKDSHGHFATNQAAHASDSGAGNGSTPYYLVDNLDEYFLT
uniref:Vascular plant one zinc finger protein n=2 Tax=Kalanchoe fedtschenkoi TaxID=63787 RepID=A0A7N1A0H7_KALFE